MINRLLLAGISLVLLGSAASTRAAVADDFATLQSQIEEVLLDSLGNRLEPQDWSALQNAEGRFAADLQSENARTLWTAQAEGIHRTQRSEAAAVAELCGRLSATLQHVAAFEMLEHQRRLEVPEAQVWRALIALPKHASAVEGALALQTLGRNQSQQAAVGELLAREYLGWQSTRVREKLDSLKRVIAAGRATPELLAARTSEISRLGDFPNNFYTLANVNAPNTTTRPAPQQLLERAGTGESAALLETYADWRGGWEASLPNLLTPQEVERRGRLLVKLVRLVPKEYHNGIRDGQIVVPLEYREAKDFVVQSQQLVNELSGAWRQSSGREFEANGAALASKLDETERLILAKADPEAVEASTKEVTKILENSFGLSAQRAGSGKGVVEEVALDVRTALKNSLAAAQEGKWREAESLRVDAYTTFDTELEVRVLPRDPNLGVTTERSFLDGNEDAAGIKTLLDQRKKGPALEAAYARTLDYVDRCKSLLKLNLSPATVIYTVISISAREGLEAVVVLAALLAGMRGNENRVTRRRVVTGAWLAIAATALTFWLSRSVIVSLSRFGEKLESIISVLAVLVLLMVTNWVFHKVYWVGWNAKLRKLTKSAERGGESRLEWLSLVTVGFLTIYREGFETTLFLQSLILESGMKWVLVGIACGVVLVGAAGWIIFVIGARLPYRKLLVFTGVLVVTILVTFLGSTVRLFQTVGWLPIHPLPALHLPHWMGFWLGLYPSVEGIVIPLLGFAYVGGAWLFVKLHALRRGAREMKAALQSESFAAHPALAKQPRLR
jgi:high-affinity iron transporter